MTNDILVWLVFTGAFVLWCFWPSMTQAIKDYHWYRKQEADRARREARRQHPSNRP